MSNQSNSIDPMKLLQSVADSAALSGASVDVAKNVLDDHDLGNMITEALNTPGSQVPQRNQTLLTVIIDDSGSIRKAGLEHDVMDGTNLYFEAQKGGQFSKGILASTFYLNGTVLYPYVPLGQIIPLSPSNYQAIGQTPLYDVFTATLLAVKLKQEELELQTGARVRTWTMVVTDGQDYHSNICQARDCHQVATDMYANEGKNIIAGMGIGKTDWDTVFQSMGILPQWILTTSADAKDLRNIFGNASRTTKNTINAGLAGGGGFTRQAMAGGFGTP